MGFCLLPGGPWLPAKRDRAAQAADRRAPVGTGAVGEPDCGAAGDAHRSPAGSPSGADRQPSDSPLLARRASARRRHCPAGRRAEFALRSDSAPVGTHYCPVAAPDQIGAMKSGHSIECPVSHSVRLAEPGEPPGTTCALSRAVEERLRLPDRVVVLALGLRQPGEVAVGRLALAGLIRSNLLDPIPD